MTLIIAHRGSAAHRPENTLEAFRLAFEEHHAQMIELDVRLSKDNIPVVIHDSTLERTTNGSGYVARYSFAELQLFDAGYWFSPEKNDLFPFRNQGLRIPSLEEVFSHFPQKAIAVEIKEKSERLCQAVVQLIRMFRREDRTIVGSGLNSVRRYLESHAPELEQFCSKKEIFGLLSGFKFLDPKGKMVASTPLASCGKRFDRKEWIETLKAKQIKSFFWTVNHPVTMKDLERLGADGIITDNPKLLYEVLSKSAGESH